MEYRMEGKTEYTVITDTAMTFEAGTYYVRYVAKKNYNSSSDTKVNIGEGEMMKVTVPNTQRGYTLTASNGQVEWHGTTTLYYTLKEGYSETENFAIKVNGVKVALNNGQCVISKAETNQNVTVEGVADITAPVGEITIATNTWNSFLNKITFGIFFKETQTVTVTAADTGSGVKSVEYYIANTSITEEEVMKITEWNVYSKAIDILPGANYVINIKVTDYAGNVTYISSEGIVIENIAPIVNGITDGKVYCETVQFTVAEDNLDTVKVDGTDVTSVNDTYTIVADNKSHTVVITDKAGNSTTFQITVNDGHSFEEWDTVTEPDCAKKGFQKRGCKHCEVEETKDIEATGHTKGSVMEENRVETTCTSAGSYDEVVYCTKCGEELNRTKKIIEAVGHQYKEPAIQWSPDYNKVTATFQCKRDASHIETKECEVESVTTASTCTKEGKVVYTARVTFDGKQYSDVKEVKLDVKGHQYKKPVFKWSPDYSKVTAIFQCKRDASHVITKKCKVKSVTNAPTCTNTGKMAYTASVTFEGKTYSDIKNVKLDIVGHMKGSPIQENRVDATATSAGSYDEVVYCIKCKAELGRTKRTINQLKQKSTSEKTKETSKAQEEKNVSGKNTTEVLVPTDVPKVQGEVAGSGSIITEVLVPTDVPKTQVNNLTVELAKGLLLEEELQQVQTGENAIVYVETTNINETVSDTDRENVQKELNIVVENILEKTGLISSKEVDTGIYFIDLSLYKKIGNNAPTKLIGTYGNELEVTIEIPENMRSDNKERVYYVFRVHDTEVSVLDVTHNIADNTLTFKTDKFSTYAITYTEPDTSVIVKDNVLDMDTTVQSNGYNWLCTWLVLLLLIAICILYFWKKHRDRVRNKSQQKIEKL